MKSNPTPTFELRQVNPERPWLGLASYTEADSAYFCGRQSDVAVLAKTVRRSPLTILYGSSGRGKSSLIGAGLIPDLVQAGHPVALIRREYDLLAEGTFIDTIMERIAPGQAARDTAERAPTLWQLVHDRQGPVVRRMDDGSGREPVLILDQFEEVFLKGLDRGVAEERQMKREGDEARTDMEAKDHAKDFLSQLADLVENRPPQWLQDMIDAASAAREEKLLDRYDFSGQRMHVVLVLREDYLARLERLRGQMPSLMRHRLELPYLSGPQALEAAFLPGTLRDPERPIIPREIAADVVRSAAGVEPETPIEDIRAVPAAILSLLCEELNEKRWSASAQERLQAAPAQDTVTEFDARSADTILEGFYEAKMPPADSRLRSVLEDKLAPAGVREKPSIKSILHELTDVPDAEATIREQLQNDRLLIVDDHGRVEFTHDKLAEIASRSAKIRKETARVREAAQATRLRYLQWLRWAAVLVCMLIGAAAWSYRMLQRTKAAEEVAATSAENAKRMREMFITGLANQARKVGEAMDDNLNGKVEFRDVQIEYWKSLSDTAKYELKNDSPDPWFYELNARSLDWQVRLQTGVLKVDELDALCEKGLSDCRHLQKLRPKEDVPRKLAGDLLARRADVWQISIASRMVPDAEKAKALEKVADYSKEAISAYDEAANLAGDPAESRFAAANRTDIWANYASASSQSLIASQLRQDAIRRYVEALGDWKASWNAPKIAPHLLRLAYNRLSWCQDLLHQNKKLEEAQTALSELDELLAVVLAKERKPDWVYLAAEAESIRSQILLASPQTEKGGGFVEERKINANIERLAKELAGMHLNLEQTVRIGAICLDKAQRLGVRDSLDDLSLAGRLAQLSADFYFRAKQADPNNVAYKLNWISCFGESGLSVSRRYSRADSMPNLLPGSMGDLKSYLSLLDEALKDPKLPPDMATPRLLSLILTSNYLNRLRCYSLSIDQRELKTTNATANAAVDRLEKLKVPLSSEQKEQLKSLRSETSRQKAIIELIERAQANTAAMNELHSQANGPQGADPAKRKEILQKFATELNSFNSVLTEAGKFNNEVPTQPLWIVQAGYVDSFWWWAILLELNGQPAEAVKKYDEALGALDTLAQNSPKPEWIEGKRTVMQNMKTVVSQKLNSQPATSTATPPN